MAIQAREPLAEPRRDLVLPYIGIALVGLGAEQFPFLRLEER